MDEAAQIDLALNTDFDPSLFDCWDDTTTAKADENPCKERDGADDSLCADRNKASSSSEGLVPAVVKQVNLMQSSNQWGSQAGQTTDTGGSCSREGDNLNRSINPDLRPQGFQLRSSVIQNQLLETNTETLIANGKSTSHQTFLPKDNSICNSVTDQPRLHPLGIPSSANCPSQNQQHLNQTHDFSIQMNQLQGNQMQYHHQSHSGSLSVGESGYNQLQQFDSSVLPLAFNTTITACGPGYQNPINFFLQQNAQQTQQANGVPGNSINQTSQSYHEQKMGSTVRQSSDKFNANSQGPRSATVSISQTTNTTSSTSTRRQTESIAGPQNTFLLQQNVEGKSKPAAVSAPNPRDLPPFLLFDAPIELRANFIQSQRQHGIPAMEDNNSLHYGMVVNGFHPQHRHRLDPPTVTSRGPITTAKLAEQVRLIDGRHGDVGSKRVKNAREQKRTQKITDLIDELRVKMERGGWKVGLKSKFHTLSSCAEYVKRLVQVNIEKEEALKKARADLEAKNRKIEDDKSQQDPSDPESTMSSLTDSTASTGQRSIPKKKGNAKEHATESGANFSGIKKEKNNSAHRSDENKETSQKSQNEGDTERLCVARQSKPVSNFHESSLSSASSSGGEGSGQKNPIPGVSFSHRMVASISDITDSNKEGSSEGNSSSSDGCRCEAKLESREVGNVGGTGSVSSDAAVARGQDNHGHDTSHADVVVTKLRKRKSPSTGSSDPSKANSDEPTSLEARFLLDYEEVFLKSNVPQILATTSGRIVAWNEFFLRITGLKADEVERLTIFSLVQPDRLSSLFEIVAASLRSGTAQTPNEFEHQSAPLSIKDEVGAADNHAYEHKMVSDQADINRKIWNYCALTLPCVSFNSESYTMLESHNKIRHSQEDSSDNTENVISSRRCESQPLYMTITLMTDKDPTKRCFHCVFTDCPGTNGNLGSVTPELLSTLFTKQNMTLNEQRNAKRGRLNRRPD